MALALLRRTLVRLKGHFAVFPRLAIQFVFPAVLSPE
jgi:hypothetical protein